MPHMWLLPFSRLSVDRLRRCRACARRGYGDARLLFLRLAPACSATALQQRQAAEDLRLRPTVHRHVVPAEQQTARTERSVALDPAVHQVVERGPQAGIDFGETPLKQGA